MDFVGFLGGSRRSDLSGSRRFHLELDVRKIRRKIDPERCEHCFEHVEGFALVLVQRIALTVGT